MQLTSTTTHAGPRDKSSWPQLQPLPADLPAPAKATSARQQVWASFSAGSIADDRLGHAGRVSPTWDWNVGDPLLSAVKLLGRDPRAALAAATAMAGQRQLQPEDWQHETHQVTTMIGLYRTTSGLFYGVPMWNTPGTNDFQSFHPLPNTLAANPDTRFTFRDDRLAAMVATDGFIANPAHADQFEA